MTERWETMSYSGNSDRPMIKKKVCRCKACGHIQSPANSECEHCGFSLALYSDILYIEVEADEWELLQEQRARKEREECARQEREERARQEREERARKEQEQRARKEQEELARQERLRQKEERRRQKPRKKDTDSRKRFGRFLRLALIPVLGLLLALAILVFSGGEKCGPHLTWSFDKDTGVLTIQGSGQMDDFNPPEEFKQGWPEDNSKEPAPWMEDYRQEILRVVIGDKVTNVGSLAFAGCTNLKEVTFGNSLEVIGQNAFWNTGLEDVFVPASVTRIESGAFLENGALRNLFLYGNPELAGDVVTWSDDLAIIAGNITSAHSFAQDNDLVFVDLSLVREDFSLGGPASRGQQWSLGLLDRTLVISGTGPIEDFNGTWMRDNAENMAFWDDSRNLPYWTEYRRLVQALKLEEGITAIGDNAFENCWNLRKVELCSTLESIGFQSFLSTAIMRLIVPGGVTTIADHAFNFCQELRWVKLPESLEVLEHGTFNMCNKLISLTIGSNTEVRARDGAQSIFSNDQNPNGRPISITIRGYVGSSAQEFAEAENFNFMAIGVKPGLVDTGKCGDNVTWWYVGDKRTLYLKGKGETWAYYLPPESMGDFPPSQIRTEDTGWAPYRTYIEHIVVGEGITSLNRNLFGTWETDNNMTSLKTIDLGSIQELHAQLKQTRLEELTLPASLRHVDGVALADNTYLKTVVVSGKTNLGPAVFFGCPMLRNITFYDDADIQDNENGDLFNGWDLPYNPVNSALHFYVRKASTAEAYAVRHNIPYSYLD